MTARVLRFHLDELRRAYGHLVPPGEDPRRDTSPFRAFRAALLVAAARAAGQPCDLSAWWEGTFNGYLLAIGVSPADALPGLDLSGVAALEDERVAPAPPSSYPLAHVEAGRAEVARNPDGSTNEAPFGAATGHFGAPGMRAIP
jgi:hypothetical protein